MAKIVRYNGNLQAFASAAIGTERTLFGEVTQANDLTSQFTADFFRGWGIVGPSDQPTLEDFNAAMYTNGQLSAYLHQIGVAEYDAAQEYHIGSIANVAGTLYRSLTNVNVGNTPASSPSNWAEASNFLDTTRIDVASAATVNLTSLAPNTRHINITGATTITDFTVLVGKCYFVRFSGALTLTNSASIVTQTGANITTAAGDTCIIRATAANVIEVLCYTEVTKLIDSARIDVASAATVNLTTSAPNTRHINITGTTTITAFTVASGRCYFVRFNAALLLTNSATLVTQSGANITTAAGDTCIIRATAANTVEILCYTPGIPQSVGYLQTWQNVSGSRTVNTNFTNTTGRPIVVSVAIASRAGNEDFAIVVAGLIVAQITNLGTAGEFVWLSAVVPAGAVYNVNTFVGAVVNVWTELRT